MIKKFDRTALLFEMLLGTDMYVVNRKIDEIRLSPEFVRVSNYMPEASGTQLMFDVRTRFNALDVYGILSMQRALEVEQEIIELDRRIKNFPSLNPYLSNGAEGRYKVKTVGDIAVEISAQGMLLNDFTTHEGVEATNRRKVLKGKVFAWYKEAKKGFMEMIDNSKLMLSRVRLSKIKFGSICFQHVFIALAAVAMIACLFFSPTFAKYLDGSLGQYEKWGITIAFYLTFLCLMLSTIVVVHYRSYPFRTASRLRKQITKQRRLVSALNNRSYDFEKSIINSSKTPRKVNTLIKRISVLGDYQKMTAGQIFDYVYCEKEYYYEHHKGGLRFHNIVYAIGFLVAIAGIFFTIIFI